MPDVPNQEFPTTIGQDASFKGEMSFEKGLRLVGKFEGKINTPGRLHVAKEAKLQADVDAGSIVVEGDVRGNLIASDRIELKQSARYEGDLHANKLIVDEGAVFNGNVTVGPDVAGKSRAQHNSPPPGARAGGPASSSPQSPASVLAGKAS